MRDRSELAQVAWQAEQWMTEHGHSMPVARALVWSAEARLRPSAPVELVLDLVDLITAPKPTEHPG